MGGGSGEDTMMWQPRAMVEQPEAEENGSWEVARTLQSMMWQQKRQGGNSNLAKKVSSPKF